MKRFAFIILMLAILVGSIMPTFAYAEESPASTKIVTLPYYTGEMASAYRNENISPIKNQNVHPDCWAFAPIGALETTLYKMGFINEESEDGFYDFAEEAMAWDCYSVYCYDCKSIDVNIDWYSGEFTCNNCGGSNIISADGYNYYNSADGGNYDYILSTYLTANPLLIDESEWEYNLRYPSSPRPENIESKYSFKILEQKFAKNLDELKRMIYSYGAVSVAITIPNMDMGYGTYDDGEGNVYATMCGRNTPIDGGHAVVAIGYDDNFDRHNFTISKEEIVEYLTEKGKRGATEEFNAILEYWEIPTYSDKYEDMADEKYVQNAIDYLNGLTDDEIFEMFGPKTDGAVLLKNSWGFYDGCNTGCLWIPYEQLDVFELFDNFAFAISSVAEEQPTDKKYSHTELGAFDFYNAENGVFANVYDFTEVTQLESVSFVSYLDEESELKIMYAPVSGDKIVISGCVLLKKLTLTPNDFYNTITLDNKIVVPAEKGAIILQFSNAENVYIAGEVTDGYSIAVAHAGESYVYGDEEEEFVPLEYDYYDLVTPANFYIDVNANISTDKTISLTADYTLYDALDTYLLQYDNLEAKYFTSETWAYFAKAKKDFDELDKNLSAWQQNLVDETVNNLLLAVYFLEYAPADYTEYDDTLEILLNVNTLDESIDEVTRQTLIVAIQKMLNIEKGQNASIQDDIDSAVAFAKEALAKVTYLPANYDEYNAIKKSLETFTIDEKDYTATTWLLYKSALELFNNVDMELTIKNQAVVDSAVKAVKEAINGLQEVSHEEEKIDALKQEFNEKLDKIQKEKEAELAQLAEQYEKTLSDYKTNSEKTIEEIKTENASNLEQLENSYNEQLASEKEDYLRELNDIRKDYNNSLEQTRHEHKTTLIILLILSSILVMSLLAVSISAIVINIKRK